MTKKMDMIRALHFSTEKRRLKTRRERLKSTPVCSPRLRKLSSKEVLLKAMLNMYSTVHAKKGPLTLHSRDSHYIHGTQVPVLCSD